MKLRDLPRTPLLVIASMFIAGAVTYNYLGEQIPMHWNVMGEIDRWEPKSLGSVFTLPLVALGLYLLLALLPYLDPRRRNLRLSGRAYGLMLTATVILMAVVYASTLATAAGMRLPVDRIIIIAISIMIAYMGSLVRSVKQNWTMGFRYSWTLADECVWAKTNDLGGKLFMAAGAVGLIGALVPAPWNFFVVMLPLLATIPVTYVYALVLYRRAHPEEMSNGA